MSEEYLLQMSGICKSFSGVRALDHVNFRVRPGKVMALGAPPQQPLLFPQKTDGLFPLFLPLQVSFPPF